MRRGEVVPVDLDPVWGSEANKLRPAALVSNDPASVAAQRLGREGVAVVPVTSNVSRAFPFQVLLPAEETGLRADSKVQAERVRVIALERLGSVVGRVPPRLMVALDEALRLHLQW
ncbi:MAG: type II toxin-antitoxin system PemK/MazF family toxin [Propionibacteriaceae bacterium]|nr:type II toxin-antitoxin system PemK/MazF family toxin [Propionibacteriaceae bacterium]